MIPGLRTLCLHSIEAGEIMERNSQNEKYLVLEETYIMACSPWASSEKYIIVY